MKDVRTLIEKKLKEVLNDRQWKIYYLKVFKDNGIGDIAKKLDINRSTVWRNINKIRQKMLEVIEEASWLRK